MTDNSREVFDRRDDADRRRVHDLDYFDTDDAQERRSFQEQRVKKERRSGWVRVGRWLSVFTGALGQRKPDDMTEE